MKKIGWIIYNGNLPGDKFLDFAQMLQKSALKYGSDAELIKNNELASLLTSSGLSLVPNKELPDYVVFTDKDIYLARQLEYLGLPVFNSADAIATSDDKIATYQRLAQLGIPIPKTVIAPKIFIEGTLDEAVINQAIDQLRFPMIVKEAFGSFGEQVYLVETKEDLLAQINAIGNKPFVFQEFISSSYGIDARLQVVGNGVVASMKRRSKSDFRANITSGGTMEPYNPTEEEEKLAVEATKAIGAAFAGVDILWDSDGVPLICEVNSNAHIRNLLDCTGVNAAHFIMKHILSAVGFS